MACIVSNLDKSITSFLVTGKLQDTENGGISDRPDDAVDVYHTYFGIAGTSFFLKQPISCILCSYCRVPKIC